MIKKVILSFALLLFMNSCSDSIQESEFRNTKYVFYQEDGKTGYWQKISKNSDFKYKKGQLTYFYPNGNTFAEIEIIDSFPNRIIKFHNKEGKLTKTEWREQDSIIKTHLENGYYKYNYSSKGPVFSEGLVENHLEQGVWKKYRNEDGTLRQIIEMKDGLEHGKRENYWPNGKQKDVSYWKKGKQIGEGIIYYENGNIEIRNFIENGEVHGLMEEFHLDGTLRFRGNYWYGILKDTAKTYYENGVLKNLKIRSLDTVTKVTIGKEYRYFSDGKLKAKSDTKNSLPDGIKISYYENGKMKDWAEVAMNELNGKVIIYYENGAKQIEGKAKGMTPLENIKYFNEKGRLIKTMVVENGEIIDSIMH
ncbi:toxin-antitoxin system YwqK family antitoxin [Kordia sp.]|uniref:toxin-antitoxin system YwqK family antitoxin n=1 Tax=Kordia sp. TaxID=1965332 RepID=UPI003D6C0978